MCIRAILKKQNKTTTTTKTIIIIRTYLKYASGVANIISHIALHAKLVFLLLLLFVSFDII